MVTLVSGVVPPPAAAKVVPVADDTVRLPLVVMFRSTLTELGSWFATARSGVPSPLKSPIATEIGSAPVANVVWAA
jgi:hypothetical protein